MGQSLHCQNDSTISLTEGAIMPRLVPVDITPNIDYQITLIKQKLFGEALASYTIFEILLYADKQYDFVCLLVPATWKFKNKLDLGKTK